MTDEAFYACYKSTRELIECGIKTPGLTDEALIEMIESMRIATERYDRANPKLLERYLKEKEI